MRTKFLALSLLATACFAGPLALICSHKLYVGQSVNFVFESSYMDCGTSFGLYQPGDSYSIVGWINQTDPNSDYCWVCNEAQQAQSYVGYAVGWVIPANAFGLYFEMFTNPTDDTLGTVQLSYTNPNFSVGHWHHWAFVSNGAVVSGVYDYTGFLLYIDGILSTLNTVFSNNMQVGETISYLTHTFIGNRSTIPGDVGIPGGLTQIQFYNVALTSAQVLANYKAGLPANRSAANLTNFFPMPGIGDTTSLLTDPVGGATCTGGNLTFQPINVP